MLLTPNTDWDAALALLTALPGALEEEHGAANFMRAGRFRRNGRRMFCDRIKPLLEAGRSFEVLTGFIDAAVGAAAGLGPDDGYFGESSSQFLSARLRDASSGEIVDIHALDEPPHES